MVADAQLLFTGFEPGEALAAFAARAEGAGAVASFVGIARSRSPEGHAIEQLFLEHHPALTLPSLEAVREAAVERFGLIAAQVMHRCGTVLPGEPIVFVAAAAPHRRAAFDAVVFMMDWLKTDAVFWKREDGVDGAHWIEPTDQDRADRARWSG